ncbi:MAG: hypothetical protein NC548_50485 [Lachnospiraceae bacterium]|nr:hypothetical protein [Lachnospiraceae bacterium]
MRDKILVMNRICALIIFSIISLTEVLGSPQDYGRDYSVRESDGSTPPIWFILAIVGGGWIGSKIFKRDSEDESKGCLGAIVGAIAAFAIIYFINQ